MTEEEAKRKYCPMSFNQKDGVSTCLGRQCMAWRETTYKVENTRGGDTTSMTTKGWCGLVDRRREGPWS